MTSHILPYADKLQSDARQTFERYHNQQAYALAADVLGAKGFIKEAIDYARSFNLLDKAADLALANDMLDEAEAILRLTSNTPKLAECLFAQGKYKEAADSYARLQQFDKAAKAYFQAKEYEKAAILYARNKQYMNAVMSYQKLGNLDMQLEMQVAAFENDLELANGDVSATNVSRTMAIYAAKAYLAKEETQQKALDILQKAEALQTTAESLEQEGNFSQAAIIYEHIGDYEKAQTAHQSDQNFDKAIEMAQVRGDDDAEITLLKQYRHYFQLGRKYIHLKQLDNALEALKHIDTNDPNYNEAMELQGDIYYKMNRFEDAILCYEVLIWSDLSPDKMCRIAYKAGYSYEASNDLEKAIVNYKKVYALDPNFHNITETIRNITNKIEALKKDSARNAPTEHGLAHKESSSPEGRAKITTMTIGDAEIPIGENDRYRIVEEIARGGMGVVYKATDTILMRTVALKVLHSKLKENKVALEYFIREARAAAQLQHINIVTVFDIGSFSDATVYHAMEYIDGKTLKQLIAQTGPFPTKFLVQLTMHACKGLQYAHDNGIIHRDVKSSNMMLAKKDKTLKILDLGLAKVVDENDRNSTQAIGTPYYMSPEQVLGNEIDCRSDIYSLGITLFELATASLPFLKGDLPYKHVHEDPPKPSSVNPQIHPKLEEIIMKMLKKKPDDRYSSCNEIYAELKHIDFSD